MTRDQVCTKKPYRSEEHAEQTIARRGWRARVYFCDPCGAHHITSEATREDRRWAKERKGKRKRRRR